MKPFSWVSVAFGVLASSGACVSSSGEIGEQLADRSALKGVFYSDAPGIQVLALQPKEGLAEGAVGVFDLTRSTDEDGYEHELIRGTYKFYKYRGEERIRFMNDGGDVVLRAPIAINGEVLTVGESELYQQRFNDEHLRDCLAANIADYGVFSESLTVNEYPYVTIFGGPDATAVDIGGSGYLADDAVFDTRYLSHELTVTITPNNSSEVYTLRIDDVVPLRGELYVSERDSQEAPSLVANIICLDPAR